MYLYLALSLMLNLVVIRKKQHGYVLNFYSIANYDKITNALIDFNVLQLVFVFLFNESNLIIYIHAYIFMGRVRFGAADSAPPFRRWAFRRRTFRCRDYSAPELFFLDSLFCSYVVSVCSSLRSR